MITQSLYIKRAELVHTEEYISNVFESKYGKVKDISFISKTNQNGLGYNGVIVNFNSWKNTEQSIKLFKEMSDSQDGTTKVVHSLNPYKFWIVQKNGVKNSEQSKSEEEINLQSEKKEIINPEEKISDLELQLEMLKLSLEAKNKKIDQLDEQNNYMRIVNEELKSQLEEKETCVKIALLEKDMQISEHIEKCNYLEEVIIYRKNKIINDLREEINDQENIIEYSGRELQYLGDYIFDLEGKIKYNKL
jgi:hypothetical protein